LGIKGFLGALWWLSQKTHPALSDPQPRLAVSVVPSGTSMLLCLCRLPSIFLIGAHVLISTTKEKVSHWATEEFN
jgi:hypothetical protein